MLYHDWEAQTYDDKWSISFDERCIDYARDRFEAVAGPPTRCPYGKALELGAGTGFFSLNLKQAGVLDEVHVTDLSPGMVEAAKANAETLGFTVEGRVADAERIPYDDDTFDVVVGHAVIHHIPDVEAAFREMLRVLKPGGRFVIAGEPTRIGDWYARRLGRLTWGRPPPSPTCRRCASSGPRTRRSSTSRRAAAALEAVVDLHTFDPDELARTALRAGRRRRPHAHRGAHRGVPGLAGPHVRGGRQARRARLGLGDVRLRLVAAAVRRRPGAGQGGARASSSTTSASPA